MADEFAVSVLYSDESVGEANDDLSPPSFFYGNSCSLNFLLLVFIFFFASAKKKEKKKRMKKKGA